MKRFLFLGSAVLAFVGVAQAKPNLDDYTNLHKILDDTHRTPGLKTTYRIATKYLCPSQKVVGLDEVEYRAAKMAQRSDTKIRTYLQGRVGHVVIGPGRQVYLIDGHHLARALYDLDLPEMLVKVAEDWSSLSEGDFWEQMVSSSYIWGEDENGKPISIPVGLPKHIQDMVDDPFRSFAWRVKKKDGFQDTNSLFAEFLWGKFFRAHFTQRQIKNPTEAVMAKALSLAHSPEASHLPGYSPLLLAHAKCRKVLREE